MVESAPTRSRPWRIARTLGLFAVAYAIPSVLERVMAAWQSRLGQEADLGLSLFYAVRWEAGSVASPAYLAALFAAMLLVPLGFVARSFARTRVRAELPDPLDRVRAWTAARPRTTKALLASPALAWLVVASVSLAFGGIGAIAATLVALPAHFFVARAGLNAFLAPTLVAMAALPVAMCALVYALSTQHIASSNIDLAALTATIAMAVGGVVIFRRASRIAIGVDGVLVRRHVARALLRLQRSRQSARPRRRHRARARGARRAAIATPRRRRRAQSRDSRAPRRRDRCGARTSRSRRGNHDPRSVTRRRCHARGGRGGRLSAADPFARAAMGGPGRRRGGRSRAHRDGDVDVDHERRRILPH